TGGSRTALPRQQTLRALIDWSYNLLSDEERTVLRCLSVFVGGWTLEAAEYVCDNPNMLRLGHADPKWTYWYLSAAPELLARAAERLDTSQGDRS
ncbi:MAG TPA: hypothetical protein VIV12_15400, partial [Streptosporangiaceae bacterium]